MKRTDATGAVRYEARPPPRGCSRFAPAQWHTFGGAGGPAAQIAPVADTLSFDKGFYLCFRAIQTLKARRRPSLRHSPMLHRDTALLCVLFNAFGNGFRDTACNSRR